MLIFYFTFIVLEVHQGKREREKRGLTNIRMSECLLMEVNLTVLGAWTVYWVFLMAPHQVPSDVGVNESTFRQRPNMLEMTQ
jgi:hypothetical protein